MERNGRDGALRRPDAAARRSALRLLTRPRHRDHEFAVLLGDKVFGAAGGAAVCILVLNLDHELFRWFEVQANFAGWSVHWRSRFFNVFRRKINKLNRCNFLSGSPRLHHFVELQSCRVRALCVKEALEGGRVLAFHCCFVLVGKCFFLCGCRRHRTQGD